MQGENMIYNWRTDKSLGPALLYDANGAEVTGRFIYEVDTETGVCKTNIKDAGGWVWDAANRELVVRELRVPAPCRVVFK